jgi:hypothetical protein
MANGLGSWVQEYWITQPIIGRLVNLQPQQSPTVLPITEQQLPAVLPTTEQQLPPVLPATEQQLTGTDRPLAADYPAESEHKVARVIGLILIILLAAFCWALMILIYVFWFLRCCIEEMDIFDRLWLAIKFLFMPSMISLHVTLILGYIITRCFMRCLKLG